MSGLGYYLKFDDSNSECIFLEYVYDEWENGYGSKTYIIQPSSIDYEDAIFYGYTINHLKT